MAEDYPASLKASGIVPRSGSIYPAIFKAVLAGREKRALGDPFGLDQFGINLVTLAPGAWSSQRHWHEKEDEFIYVLDGEITLANDSGEHRLTAGTCAGFKAGVANGHHLVNKSARPATYLEVGTRSPEERATYPDVDMQAVKTGGIFVVMKKDGSAY